MQIQSIPKARQLTFDLFPVPDVEWAWEEFLPYVEKCWRVQRESFSAGNCRDWWGSRYGDWQTRIRRMTWEEMKLRPRFRLIWEKYGQVMQGGAR